WVEKRILYGPSCFCTSCCKYILEVSWSSHVDPVRLLPGEPIIAAPGDDVILPCRLDSQEDLSGFSVEWTKLEVKPDPKDPQGRIPFVYFYRNRQTMTTVMIESFIPRVSLNQDGFKRGDVTLKIRNVSLQDEGKYSCFIPGKNFRETVQLVVGEFALQVLPHMKNICPEQQAGNDVISLFQSQTESELQPWKHPRLTSSSLQIQEETGSGSVAPDRLSGSFLEVGPH
uniref:Ig-like domain-containing protein n=1 Tax=Oryzias latipes TaxID=8090 RepID=A0A3P9ICY6_ORYLA